jgi:hypothetical protein
MPSTPRGRNAATTVAVVLAVLLAVVWLRSSGDGTPWVPVGLPVETTPTTVAEPADPTGLRQGEEAEAERPAAADGKRTGGAPESGRRSERRERSHAPTASERRPAGQRSRRRKRADRAGGGEDARARRQAGARGRVGPIGQDPPATAPAPSAGSGAADSAPPASASPARPAPEFAIG